MNATLLKGEVSVVDPVPPIKKINSSDEKVGKCRQACEPSRPSQGTPGRLTQLS